jgi:hypothetical protein
LFSSSSKQASNHFGPPSIVLRESHHASDAIVVEDNGDFGDTSFLQTLEAFLSTPDFEYALEVVSIEGRTGFGARDG